MSSGDDFDLSSLMKKNLNTDSAVTFGDDYDDYDDEDEEEMEVRRRDASYTEVDHPCLTQNQ